MRADLSLLGRHAVVYGLSSGAIQAIGLLTLPVFAREFVPAQYGILELASVGFAALIVAVDGGLGSAMQRFWFDTPEEQEEDRRLVASTATLGSVAAGLVAALLLILLREPIAGWLFDDRGESAVVVLIGLAIPLGTLAIFLRDVLRVRFRPGHFAVSAVIAAGVQASVGLVGVLVFDGGIEVVVAGITAGQAASALYAYVLVRHDVRLRFSTRELRRLLGFGLPLVPAAAAMWAIGFLDRVLLSQLDGLAATGEYAIATRFSSVLLFFTGAFATAYTPFLYSLHTRDPEGERELRGSVLTYAAIVFAGVAVLLTLFSKEIAHLVAPDYDRAYHVVGILCLGTAVGGLAPIAAAQIGIAKRNGYIARYTAMTLAANTVLCFVLIPPFGLVGAAIATGFGYLLLVALYLQRSQKLEHVPFQLGRIGRLIVLSAAVMVVGQLDLASEPLTLALKARAVVAWVAALLLARVVGAAEIQGLREVAGGLRARLTAA